MKRTLGPDAANDLPFAEAWSIWSSQPDEVFDRCDNQCGAISRDVLLLLLSIDLAVRRSTQTQSTDAVPCKDCIRDVFNRYKTMVSVDILDQYVESHDFFKGNGRSDSCLSDLITRAALRYPLMSLSVEHTRVPNISSLLSQETRRDPDDKTTVTWDKYVVCKVLGCDNRGVLPCLPLNADDPRLQGCLCKECWYHEDIVKQYSQEYPKNSLLGANGIQRRMIRCATNRMLPVSDRKLTISTADNEAFKKYFNHRSEINVTRPPDDEKVRAIDAQFVTYRKSGQSVLPENDGGFGLFALADLETGSAFWYGGVCVRSQDEEKELSKVSVSRRTIEDFLRAYRLEDTVTGCSVYPGCPYKDGEILYHYPFSREFYDTLVAGDVRDRERFDGMYLAGFANEPNDVFEVNAEYSTLWHMGDRGIERLSALVLTRAVEKNREIFVHYGRDYLRNAARDQIDARVKTSAQNIYSSPNADKQIVYKYASDDCLGRKDTRLSYRQVVAILLYADFLATPCSDDETTHWRAFDAFCTWMLIDGTPTLFLISATLIATLCYAHEKKTGDYDKAVRSVLGQGLCEDIGQLEELCYGKLKKRAAREFTTIACTTFGELDRLLYEPDEILKELEGSYEKLLVTMGVRLQGDTDLPGVFNKVCQGLRTC